MRSGVVQSAGIHARLSCAGGVVVALERARVVITPGATVPGRENRIGAGQRGTVHVPAIYLSRKTLAGLALVYPPLAAAEYNLEGTTVIYYSTFHFGKLSIVVEVLVGR